MRNGALCKDLRASVSPRTGCSLIAQTSDAEEEGLDMEQKVRFHSDGFQIARVLFEPLSLTYNPKM